MPHDLEKLADATESLLGRFEDSGGMFGLTLQTNDSARFKGYCIEAQALIADRIGGGTSFSVKIEMAAQRLLSGPSYSDVEEAVELMRAAARTIKRRQTEAAASTPQKNASPYVDARRIRELESLGGTAYDFRRLIELCREINVAAGHDCHMATAMLLRAILDHIPPVFGFTAFRQVSANYAAPPSLRKQFKHLQESFRDKADMLLHGTIKDREDVPTAVQVDYRNDLDVVLGELIRLTQASSLKRESQPV